MWSYRAQLYFQTCSHIANKATEIPRSTVYRGASQQKITSIPDTRFSISCSSEQESWCVGCGALPSIPNGYLELKEQGNTSYKSKAATVCDDGYETVTAEVTCLSNASWEGVVCTVKDCGPAPSISFGDARLVDAGNSTYGAKTEVTCYPGYETSKEVITCMVSGVWDNTTCLPKDCGSSIS
ncbi:sushi, von Willebrand factor type A, EGF and pentraxin domain-containing protein 1-like [Mercenaria mercenaria]|uniref:sushi, von Willebrand factor type A, EGF and pentraxin domain-containing protein 1-like n=1 Tax=Mercenaria mercenaria TaxID=6596 RepID=UPI00234F5C26|nr:sushi, von Willebrand factor type A, EGF and pentraxin domain-containing protein 1-like [Mercenaria mercenaria]